MVKEAAQTATSRIESYAALGGAVMTLLTMGAFVGEPWAEGIVDKKIKGLEGKVSTIQSQQQAQIGNQIRLEEKTKNIEGDVGEIKGDLKALQVDIQELLRRTPR